MEFILNESGLAGMIQALQNPWFTAVVWSSYICVCVSHVCLVIRNDILPHFKLNLKIFPRFTCISR